MCLKSTPPKKNPTTKNQKPKNNKSKFATPFVPVHLLSIYLWLSTFANDSLKAHTKVCTKILSWRLLEESAGLFRANSCL